MKKIELILICRKCGASHLITPPKKKLKETTKIELNCYRCRNINEYDFVYKLKRGEKNGSDREL